MIVGLIVKFLCAVVAEGDVIWGWSIRDLNRRFLMVSLIEYTRIKNTWKS
ncbi:hypothetical protein KOR42_04490 [Thalassoglobus neptunius]|uniref:Uncharacterized protein n=1 Tax=Thalassoglobus neptunius TaxID=1938619 RepID=A0A5C5X443_9PLAN|nr:hypothetical protein KOR42_04490 [Thalassoglobus neptunius]